mgnify:CR=1 FL=1|tara:strand:+ start:193 stop:456 length:264 start_codon:yes stop_codon:yes gene_type:complete
MTNTNKEQLRNDAVNVMENIEDTVEHICDTHFLSGEKVWCMIAALSDYKLAEFSDSPDIEYEDELEEEDDNEDWTNNIGNIHSEEDD